MRGGGQHRRLYRILTEYKQVGRTGHTLESFSEIAAFDIVDSH